MRLVLFGATGMVGQGALRECLLDDRVDDVVSVSRTPTGKQAAKLREIVLPELTDLHPIVNQLSAVDGCLFCLGVSSVGMSEAAYREVTFDLTMAAARVLYDLNPGLRFCYVSGRGTDTHGRAMWARVKGETEDALLAMSPQAYMFRPGFIQPQHGVRSKTRLYSTVYSLTGPLFPVLRRAFPAAVTTTERLGRAMVAVATGATPPTRVLETRDINAIGEVRP
jgi:uncharacterized protein YbjT (DUF2867 family)